MSDPLSVAASVVGLLTAAAQVSLILNTLISKAKSAPKECKRVRNDVDDIRNVLGQLQMFIVGTKQASRSRRALIMVDQVTATLASCVTTFDSLKLFVEGLQSDQTMGILDRIRWISKEGELQNFQTRIEAHKATLSLMLIILTCQKQDDAEDKVDALHDSVEELKVLNTEILARMAMWDLSKIGPNVLTNPSSIDPLSGDQSPINITSNTLTSPNHDVESSKDVPVTVQKDARGFAFEELLMNTRAYRNAAHNSSDAFSVITSAGRTATWSVLSGLSLSEMSNLAILAIPVYQSDLHDKEVYDFETIQPEIEPPVEDDTKKDSVLQESEEKQSRLLKSWRKTFRSKPDKKPLPAVKSLPDDRPLAPRVFGVALSESIRYANVAISLLDEEGKSFIYGFVPLVVAKIGVFLKEKGLFAEEIFAKNGHPVRISKLQTTFDSPDGYGKDLLWTGYTVFDAASLLLRYFKSLPEPIVPYDSYAKFILPLRLYQELQKTPDFDQIQETEHAKLVKNCQECVIELPPLNRQLLIYLLDLLAVFASREPRNHMNSRRLAGLFNPGVVSESPASRTQQEHALADDLLVFLIENPDNFYIGMDMR